MNWIRKVKLNWRYTAGWLAIAGAVAGLELLALTPATGSGTTLSENVWGLLGLHPLIWLGGVAFFAWLLPHFFLGRR